MEFQATFSSSERKQRQKAIGALTFTAVLWALSFPLYKALSIWVETYRPGISSESLAASSLVVRFLLGAVVLVGFNMKRWGIRSVFGAAPMVRREWEQGALLAFFAGGGLWFQMDGLAYTEPSTSAFLSQCYCIFIPLSLALWHRRRPDTLLMLAALSVVVGAAILAGEGGAPQWRIWEWGRGELETLMASIFLTGQILSVERRRYCENRLLVMTGWMFLCIGLGMGALLWGRSSESVMAELQAYTHPFPLMLLAALTLFCTLWSYVLMNRWQGQVTATEAGLLYTLEPVFALFWIPSLFPLFRRGGDISLTIDPFSIRIILGGCLILVANIAVQWRSLRRR